MPQRSLRARAGGFWAQYGRQRRQGASLAQLGRIYVLDFDYSGCLPPPVAFLSCRCLLVPYPSHYSSILSSPSVSCYCSEGHSCLCLTPRCQRWRLHSVVSTPSAAASSREGTEEEEVKEEGEELSPHPLSEHSLQHPSLHYSSLLLPHIPSVSPTSPLVPQKPGDAGLLGSCHLYPVLMLGHKSALLFIARTVLYQGFSEKSGERGAERREERVRRKE
ncbi:hypothetical protein E2C01_003372 [Portunus trituberculatus]|uniref:Uncharacterized protein n=1 Tax=Portunus trituberculatus TaxID=210409 RepID=A0A5B7CTD9_PORTR|nr:hypothetical protein [Portunus trituberculatus]